MYMVGIYNSLLLSDAEVQESHSSQRAVLVLPIGIILPLTPSGNSPSSLIRVSGMGLGVTSRGRGTHVVTSNFTLLLRWKSLLLDLNVILKRRCNCSFMLY